MQEEFLLLYIIFMKIPLIIFSVAFVGISKSYSVAGVVGAPPKAK